MPAALPYIALAVVAGASTYSAVQQNQQLQHAKGAAQAQETAMNAQIADAKARDDASLKQKAAQGSATQTAAMSALRAAMSGSSGMGGSILTSPTGTSVAPVATKTLLGA